MKQADRQSSQDGERIIRFGIHYAGTELSRWASDCVRKLVALPYARLEVVLISGQFSEDLFDGSSSPLGEARSSLYERALPSLPALLPTESPDEFDATQTLYCRTNYGNSAYLSDDDLEVVSNLELDFILNFGPNKFDDKIHEAARYGIWSFHHGDRKKYSGGIPGFWEIYSGDRTTKAMLFRATDNPYWGTPLKEGQFPTLSYSYAENLGRVLSDSAAWPAQVCTDIMNETCDYLDADSSTLAKPEIELPTAIQLLLFRLKILKNVVTNVAQVLFRHDEWCIGIVERPIASCLKEDIPPEVRWLPNLGPTRYSADPFGITSEDNVTILCEDFDYSTHRGRITALEISETGDVARSDIAISQPFHLSYPYIVQEEGETYCIPESSESGELALYKATCLPYEWEKTATLIEEFSGLDATIFEFDNYWWLTCTSAGKGRNDKLLIWYSDELRGPWIPHAQNPVKIDVRSARPAGTPFVHDGELYRPAQDCSATYGGRVVINRVLKLTPTTFEEEPYRTIDPQISGLYDRGFHTLSRLSETRTLVDGKRYRFQPAGLLHALRFIAAKAFGSTPTTEVATAK